jgi:hypothetical protein
VYSSPYYAAPWSWPAPPPPLQPSPGPRAAWAPPAAEPAGAHPSAAPAPAPARPMVSLAPAPEPPEITRHLRIPGVVSCRLLKTRLRLVASPHRTHGRAPRLLSHLAFAKI